MTLEELNDFEIGVVKGEQAIENGLTEYDLIKDEPNLQIRKGVQFAFRRKFSEKFDSDSLLDSILSYKKSHSISDYFSIIDASLDICDASGNSRYRVVKSDNGEAFIAEHYDNSELEEAVNRLDQDDSLELINNEDGSVDIRKKQDSAQSIIDDAEYSLDKVNNDHYRVLKEGVPTYDLVKKQSRWTCTCPGFKYRNSCRHLALLSDVLPKRHPRAELEAFVPDIEQLFSGYPKWEIVGSYRRNCFAAGTLVKTIHGAVPIEEVMVGDLVFNGFGKVTKVTDVIVRESTEWVKVEYRRGSYILCTPDHEFLIWKSNSPSKDFEWVRADSMNVRHWKMVTPLLELPSDISIGTTLAFVLGWYLADGNMHWYDTENSSRFPYKNGHIYHVNLSANSLRVKEFLHLIAELGFRDFSFYSNDEDNALSINVRDWSLIEFILEWGGFTCSKLGEEKFANWKLLRLVPEEKEAFLQGFWLGDGSYGKYNTSESCRFYNTNQQIIEVLDLMLSTKYKTLRYIRNGNGEEKDLYEVRLSGRDARDFVTNMPSVYSDSKYLDLRIKQWKSSKEVSKQCDAFGQHITNVSKVELVANSYCLSVEEGESFLANNFSVHNCSDFKDVDIIVECSVSDFNKLLDRIKQDSSYEHTMAGNDIIRGKYHGYDLDISRVIPGEWGSFLLYRTGSANFNMKMRSLAKSMGMALNEHGLFDRETGRLIANDTEEDIFNSLGMEFVKPEDRK